MLHRYSANGGRPYCGFKRNSFFIGVILRSPVKVESHHVYTAQCLLLFNRYNCGVNTPRVCMYYMFRSPVTISVYTEPLQSLFFLPAIPPYTGQCLCCRVPSVLVVFAVCLPAFRGILPMILCLMLLRVRCFLPVACPYVDRVLPARMTAWEISSPYIFQILTFYSFYLRLSTVFLV
jgi:hypothetical protein